MELDDELARRMLPLLDGTRDLDAIAAELREPPEAIRARLEHLARLALLL